MKSIAILFVLLACKGDKQAERKPEPETAAEKQPEPPKAEKKAEPPEPKPGDPDHEPMPADAPSSTACKVDADCEIVTQAPLSESPCCDATVPTGIPVAKVFVEYMKKWRAKECGFECPPHPPGETGQREACGKPAKCVNAQCACH
jgi:hypothetical protein